MDGQVSRGLSTSQVAPCTSMGLGWECEDLVGWREVGLFLSKKYAVTLV